MPVGVATSPATSCEIDKLEVESVVCDISWNVLPSGEVAIAVGATIPAARSSALDNAGAALKVCEALCDVSSAVVAVGAVNPSVLASDIDESAIRGSDGLWEVLLSEAIVVVAGAAFPSELKARFGRSELALMDCDVLWEELLSEAIVTVGAMRPAEADDANAELGDWNGPSEVLLSGRTLADVATFTSELGRAGATPAASEESGNVLLPWADAGALNPSEVDPLEVSVPEAAMLADGVVAADELPISVVPNWSATLAESEATGTNEA